MMRMYDGHLHDVSGDNKGKNDNKNIAFHMEEGDGILHSPQSHDTNTAMDAAYIYHPNDVIPRKKKSRQSPRTVLTCLAVCTSASPLSSHGQNYIPNYPSPQRRHRRRPLLLLTSLLVMCITVAALWYIQETDVIDLSNKVEDNMNDEANKKLPKILQFDHDNDPNYYEPETKIVVSKYEGHYFKYKNLFPCTMPQLFSVCWTKMPSSSVHATAMNLPWAAPMKIRCTDR